jgi:UDP-glucose 4-epimerase
VRIAVTGGGGFIGNSVMIAGRAMGHEMYSFDKREGNDVQGQLRALDDFKPDSVVHLAGVLGTHELFDNPHVAVDVNIHGTINVLNWCRDHKAGYVGITMPPVFPSVYTATKICADRLATAWHREYGVPVAKVRAFNAFGPGQAYGDGHPQKIIPTFSVYSWSRQPIPIWGDGTQTVDLIDVTQIARIIIDAVNFDDDVTFDAGSGRAITVNEVAEYVNKVTGSDAGVAHLPMRRGELPTHIVATGEGWNRLNWIPGLSFDALQQTIHAYHSMAHGPAVDL